MSENIFERYCVLYMIIFSGWCFGLLFSSQKSGSSRFSRLSAAIELFYAFANRCDAYCFNHAIGLITFSSVVCVKVEFTQIMDYFKVLSKNIPRSLLWSSIMDFACSFLLQETLSTIVCGGQTALHSALTEAADKLEKFTRKYPTCHKWVTWLEYMWLVNIAFCQCTIMHFTW